MKQAKNRAKLVITNMKAIIIKFKEEKISLSMSFIQIQPHLVCAIGKVFNLKNIDEEEVRSENYDKINMLIIIMN